MSSLTAPATLYIVPNTLDLGFEHVPPLQDQLPLSVIRCAAQLSYWAAENAKTTRAFLKRVAEVVPLHLPLQQMHIQELPRPHKGSSTPAASLSDLAFLLEPLKQGQSVGLISEAGLPGVADPGAALVRLAHQNGARVVVLPGSSALSLALAASGLQGQSFSFVGYLPTDTQARAHKLHELESLSARHQQTQLMIETPYRNQALLAAMLQHLKGTTWLSVSVGLTLPQGLSYSHTVAHWKSKAASFELPNNQPAVFSFLGA